MYVIPYSKLTAVVRVELLEGEAIENGKSVALRDAEIAMLKEKVRGLHGKTTSLYDEGTMHLVRPQTCCIHLILSFMTRRL